MRKRIAALLVSLLFLTAVLSGCAALDTVLSDPDVQDALIDTAQSLLSATDAPAADGGLVLHTNTPEPAQPGSTPGQAPGRTETPAAVTADGTIAEDGAYTEKDDVALYLHTYGRLPENFISKKDAQKLGWTGGGLDKYAYGKCIGGDTFGNREGLLPKASGRTYYECDIDTLHAKERGAKRIVFSNDGLIYYTDDHYASYTLLYGGD